MTTISPPSPATDQAEAVFRVFENAGHPLTLAGAKKLYRGPKIGKDAFSAVVESQLLMQGRVFKCSAARGASRYWVHDEEEKVRESTRKLLASGPRAEGQLATAVNRDLPQISSASAIREFIQKMLKGGALHEWPSSGGRKILALQPFDPVTLISFKKRTLDDLSALLEKVEPLGVSVERLLQVLHQRLRPTEAGSELEVKPPVREEKPGTEVMNGSAAELEDLILKGMRDLEPGVEHGATVLLRDLRRNMPAEYQHHETFDTAVIRLADQDRVVLHRHDQPSFLTDAERDELVRDEKGTYFTSIAYRVQDDLIEVAG